jgi:hypothetical protein
MSGERVRLGVRRAHGEEKVMSSTTMTSWCTCCRADMAFEQPECAEDHGHGVDCPEWACVGCGEAVVVAFGLPEPTGGVEATGQVA